MAPVSDARFNIGRAGRWEGNMELKWGRQRTTWTLQGCAETDMDELKSALFSHFFQVFNFDNTGDLRENLAPSSQT